MEDRLVRPAGLVKPEPVLGEAGQVDYSEIGTPGRSGDGTLFCQFFLCLGTGGRVLEIVQYCKVIVIRSRLSEIVIAGPDEFSQATGILILILPLLFGDLAPGDCVKVVGTDLEVFLAEFPASGIILDREEIHSSCADG